jgi:ATP-dependent Lhr-like helicase
MTSGVERLHPAVAHHLANSLGWRSLRPLQENAVAPVLAGDHALLVAPTAAGKTEAALMPLLSRMATERWGGVSVLYLCPLRALLNNLAPRVTRYCELLGRSASVWHGDVGDAERRRILRDPPDVLLTTPESIEAMGLSRRVDHRSLFGAVRVVVVDEIHAFAGDDRGWHVLALLNRLDELSPDRIQRIGLSATVGNPTELLDWLCAGADDRRTVVTATGTDAIAPDMQVDWVGGLANAAKVISGIHRGEKRLVFADSRARVEELAAALRQHGTTVFVSHSSLSADERRLAERAFAEERDCVIVATSTLELGIDVGDLDRVVQLGAPRTVASVLQRIGRTGRRSGSVRNCLFLATQDEELLQALALTALIKDGWVEPLRPPPRPAHLAAQQLLARVLTEGRIGRSTWPGSLQAVTAIAELDDTVLREIAAWMVERDILIDLDGVLQMGEAGERLFGRRHFIDVTSSFLSEPLLVVRWGSRQLGRIDPSALLVKDGERPVILLGGVSWAVGDVDWDRRLVWVEPTQDEGRSRWSGAGGALSVEVCHAIRSVLAHPGPPAVASRRACSRLDELHERFCFVREGHTSLQADGDRGQSRWWTFAGGRANSGLRARLEAAGVRSNGCDDLGVSLLGTPLADELRAAARTEGRAEAVDQRRLAAIKFNEAVPEQRLREMLRARDLDLRAIDIARGEPLDAVGTDGRG